MRILVTNDDGILADGLWVLVKELKSVAPVVVVAPDRERSAIGTAITLGRPLRVRKVKPRVPEIEAYAVNGTPGDCVILALEKLARNEVALVASGINQGPNLGNDVLVSGTVAGALQGYLRGLPALAVSAFPTDNSLYLGKAARIAAQLAARICSITLPATVFLNVNMPLPSSPEIKGTRATHLASESHIDTAEEDHGGKARRYRLVRQQTNMDSHRTTDIWAVEHGYISVTPLHSYLRIAPTIRDNLCSEILEEL